MNTYGKELILDLHNCDVTKFTREKIDNFLFELCEKINMEMCDRHFWDYNDDPNGYEKAPDHLKGISAIQFITTSNVTIHTLDILKCVYINIFSCKDFDTLKASEFCRDYFYGKIIKMTEVNRV